MPSPRGRLGKTDAIDKVAHLYVELRAFLFTICLQRLLLYVIRESRIVLLDILASVCSAAPKQDVLRYVGNNCAAQDKPITLHVINSTTALVSLAL